IKSQVQQAAGAGAIGSTSGTRFAAVAREMDAIVDRGYVIIGSPDDVTEQLREVARNLNVGHLMLLLQFGNMGKQVCRANTKLFAEKVMPNLKGMFGEWEDRWWPQPMGRAQRAEVPAFLPKLAAE
ncbi:MAG TPA: hypothetical protein VNE67_10360, partial [Acetobacteraceae bacterium]|nr:hypothetical protein [Acetobacteraceae bacterium]